jgi:HlyD family secretion protein
MFKYKMRLEGMKRMANRQLIAVMALAIMTPLGAGQAQSYGRATTVETKAATEQLVAPKTQIQARVKAGPMEVITAPATGTVRLKGVQIGDQVKKGQMLAEQDVSELEYERRLLRIKKQEAEQNLEQLSQDLEFEKKLSIVAEEKLALLSAKLTRAEKLRASQTISFEAFDTTKTAYLAAREQSLIRQRAQGKLRAELADTQLALNSLNYQLEKLNLDIQEGKISSPVDGQIFEIADATALFMREGEKIARIRTNSGFEVEADLPADFVRFITADTPLTAQIEATARNNAVSASTPIPLRLRAILPTQNSRTGTRPVRFTPVTELPLFAQAENTALTLGVPTNAPQKLVTVPQDALVPVNEGHVIFVAIDGRAERRIVSLGGTIQDRVVILSGIRANEQVITKGNEILSDGAEITTAGSRKKKEENKGQKPGPRNSGQNKSGQK